MTGSSVSTGRPRPAPSRTGAAQTAFQVSAGAHKPDRPLLQESAALRPVRPAPATTSASKPWVTQTIALEAASGTCTSCVYGLEAPTTNYNFTDYGLAIQAAETNLDNLAATRPTAQKVIVILSDGDGNITNSGAGHTPTPLPCTYGIQQAEAAEQHQPTNTVPGNTWVFTIAYGALYKSEKPRVQPRHDRNVRRVVGAVRDDPDGAQLGHRSHFPLGDSQAKSTLCPSNTYEPSDPAHRYFNEATGSSLEQVFTEVGVALSTPRLISNDAT